MSASDFILVNFLEMVFLRMTYLQSHAWLFYIRSFYLNVYVPSYLTLAYFNCKIKYICRNNTRLDIDMPGKF